MKSKEKKKDLHHHIVNGKCIRCGKSFKESLCNECNNLRGEVKEVMYSKRVGFMYAVGDEDLLVDELVGLVEEEKRKSRKEALEEIKKKFGGGIVIGIGDNDLGVKVPDIRVPELDVWVEEELDKLSDKGNGEKNR